MGINLALPLAAFANMDKEPLVPCASSWLIAQRAMFARGNYPLNNRRNWYEKRVSEKKNPIVIIVFWDIYAIVALFLPILSYFRHTHLSLWIQAVNYMVLGTIGLIAFRSMIKECVNQWRIHAANNLLQLMGSFVADIILSDLSVLPLTILYPNYVSINDNSVAEAAAIPPIPILFIAFGILGLVTEEFIFQIIPIEKEKRYNSASDTSAE